MKKNRRSGVTGVLFPISGGFPAPSLFKCLPNPLSCHGLIGFLTQFQRAPLLVRRSGAVMMFVCVRRECSVSLVTSSPVCWDLLSPYRPHVGGQQPADKAGLPL